MIQQVNSKSKPKLHCFDLLRFVGFVVQTVVQHIRNKSKKWSLSFNSKLQQACRSSITDGDFVDLVLGITVKYACVIF